MTVKKIYSFGLVVLFAHEFVKKLLKQSYQVTLLVQSQAKNFVLKGYLIYHFNNQIYKLNIYFYYKIL